MRESTFIFKHKDKWARIENEEAYGNTDELSQDFVSLLNDISYAKTHYPNSQLSKYLNALAANIYGKIYLRSAQSQNPLRDFWKFDLPLIVGKNKKVLYTALLLFLASVFLGLLFSHLDTQFISTILGSNYVQMTEENINDGRPFGVYNDAYPILMFFQILANNFFVGLILFTSGIFFGLGSIYATFKNGIMIGAFFSLFWINSLLVDALFVIMLHGTFELMGLVLECMAGLCLGLHIARNSAHSRKESLLMGMKVSAKIFLGGVPLTFIAAIIESFVTYLGTEGLSAMPLPLFILLALVLFSCLLSIVWYFFIYSGKVAKTVPNTTYYEKIYA
ncbi:stage II sporulation protein M [Marinilongibacter aquaticus]|uniref:stage II sporulation protein M n=1 Tax=Marinilongibacter aquaticus TaxID=2975157 RepID=UPI0021BD5C6E|nr:stage II sporulation protein M [Marinilongibacter aquaticus]UBM59186.1 stage II sporulation protein M [Marinilongibacter aquaticus]